jgi:hypothetical protein
MTHDMKRKLFTAAIVLAVLGALGYTAHTLNLVAVIRQMHGG